MKTFKEYINENRKGLLVVLDYLPKNKKIIGVNIDDKRSFIIDVIYEDTSYQFYITRNKDILLDIEQNAEINKKELKHIGKVDNANSGMVEISKVLKNDELIGRFEKWLGKNI